MPITTVKDLLISYIKIVGVDDFADQIVNLLNNVLTANQKRAALNLLITKINTALTNKRTNLTTPIDQLTVDVNNINVNTIT